MSSAVWAEARRQRAVQVTALAVALLAALAVLAACEGAAAPVDAGARVDVGAPGDARPRADTGAGPDATDGAALEAAADAGAGSDAAEGAALDAGPDDAGAPDGGAPAEVDPTRPLRVLFIGNSFTFYGPVPGIVDILANDAGWPDPVIEYSAFGGESLEGHRARPETLALVDRGGWDVVVLQELSTRPTDALGDPTRFLEDATWFYDRVQTASPGARVVLYETWAREAAHSYYPDIFRDPAEMQAQLRAYYEEAALRYIPAHRTVMGPAPELARVGDAWERHLARPAPLRLHDTDDYHAGVDGQYLNALVIQSTIYRRASRGRTPWRLSLADARVLQEDADAVTGWPMAGGPAMPALPVGLVRGQQVALDLGDTPAAARGWNSLDAPADGALADLVTADGAASTVDVFVTVPFGGVNGVGSAANALGYPAEASRDSFFAGSFTDHADGLLHPAQLTLRGLDPAGLYTLTLFASRSGDDGGLGRLSRYTVGGATQDLEVADNTARAAVFTGLAPSAAGELVVDVAVSPAGRGRFAYLGVVVLARP